MNIENIAIKDIKPYERNAKKHDETQIKNVMESIKQFGFAQPLVVSKDNVLIIGHCRLIAAKRLKLKEVPVVRMDDLTQEQVDKLRLLDNKLNESEWDFDLLAEEIPELDFDGFDIDWGLSDESKEELEKKYTEKTDIPQYEPTDKEWELNDLYDDEKKQQLIDEINQADIEVEVKEFLKMAAYRHVKFNYKRIADFYAKADKEIQELMEKSALVIIDYEDAIKNGYSLLNSMAGEYAYD
jgi:uncharacterized protein YjgD (DUF1641 family)